MGKAYSKQPNGLYCRVSSVSNAFEYCNMPKEEVLRLMEATNYCHCCDDSGKMTEWNKARFDKEADTEYNGLPDSTQTAFFVNFKEILEDWLTMSNYRTIDELRNILMVVGYEDWETFETDDYREQRLVLQYLRDNFDKYRDKVKEYYSVVHEFFVKDYVTANEKTLDEYLADVKAIETYEDLVNLCNVYKHCGEVQMSIIDFVYDNSKVYDEICTRLNIEGLY